MKRINNIIILTSFFILSGCFSPGGTAKPDKAGLVQLMDKVAVWQIDNFEYAKNGSAGYLHDYGLDAWTNSVFYLGLAEYAAIADNRQYYYDWLYAVGTKCNWQPPQNFSEVPALGIFHADEFCIGQLFLKMTLIYRNDTLALKTQQRLDAVIQQFPATGPKGKQWWSWCDALFMAPPLYAQMARQTGNPKYLEFMDTEFKRTYKALYSQADSLFFRDKSYFDKREQNGKKIFWGRGNGWVAAGMVNILKNLPETSAYRSFYEDLLREHLICLAALADANDAWHASLLDPESYPAPEASATALITFALAYAVNQGILDKETYLPQVLKSWETLSGMVGDDGKLGWVQPIGADPKSVTKDMTAVYGTGAFLLAASEIYKLAE
ncbi:MAG: glycoside hydrolase family 105 protein [Draconibacterium sp.]